MKRNHSIRAIDSADNVTTPPLDPHSEGIDDEPLSIS